MIRQHPQRNRLTQAELQQMFNRPEGQNKYGAVVNVDQLAELLGVSPKTVRKWIRQDRFPNSIRRRGKRYAILRDRALQEYFDGPDWDRLNPN